MAPSSSLLDLDHWRTQLPALHDRYQSAHPYPHIVLEDFLRPAAAETARQAFPSVRDEGWIHYVHFNEKKHGLNKMDLLPAPLRAVIEELNAPPFVAFLSELTGIAGLQADPMLEGGGLHQSLRGGFLNIHADFTVHPHRRQLGRRVNVLLRSSYFSGKVLERRARANRVGTLLQLGAACARGER